MSSANFFTGYNPEKPTSKVINPPGGKSSNIFGGNDDTQQSVANNKARNQHSSVFFGDDSTPQHQAQPQHQQQYQNNANDNRNRMQSSNIFGEASANQARQNNRGYNPITGQSYEPAPAPVVQPVPVVQPAPVVQQQQHHYQNQQEESVPQGKPLHTSSRVLQPPGGKSHGIW